MNPRAAQPEEYDHPPPEYRERLAFGHAHRSAASPIVHVLKTAIMLSPLVLSEFVKDPSKTWKWARIAIGAATLADQVDYAIRCAD